MATRKKPNEKRYVDYRKSKPVDKCDFCDFDMQNSNVIDEHKYFWIVKNVFGYDIWDNMEVSEHLMIVPKHHIESISKLEQSAVDEYGKIIAKYDGNGYSYYARSADNKSKSVPHQHTHLLKFTGKRKRFLIFIKKPYLLWFR